MPRPRLAKLACLAACATIALIGPEPFAHAQEADAWGGFGVQTEWIDKSVDPGDDFDRYVSGIWHDTVEFPEDKSRIGAFNTLRDLSEDRLKAILDELVEGEFAPGTAARRVADAYRSFMDTAAIEAAGLEPAQPYLDRIFAADSTADLVALFASPGFASPIEVGVDPDQKQSELYALYLGQAGLGLPDRDYYLADGGNSIQIRQKYLEYLAFLLGKAGYADPEAAAQAVYALETRMAREMWDRAVQRNRDLTYNKLGPDEFAQLGSPEVLRAFLEGIGAGDVPSAIVAQLPPTDEELAEAKIAPEDAAARLGGGLPATLELIQSVPLATWQAYLAAHFLSDHADMLPSEIDEASFAFYGTVLGGQPQQRARWKRGISAVERQIGELLGKLYAERHYPPEERAAMEELVANLRKAMAANLADLDWMSPQTRTEALEKLAAFNPKIGAPETFKTYEGLEISPDAALANQLEAQRWQARFAIDRIGRPVDRAEWFMLPQTVNAYFNPTFNEVVFPAAILQPPFFNLTADPAVNYGAIGAVIGHELGHGFDDQGAKFDGQGNIRDWWTPQDKRRFEALQDKLVAQYNQFCPLDEGKTCINGRLTLGENIGDLGGLSLAYRAYRLSLDGKEPPVIGGFTGDQRFFMAWAQIWRGKAREELARQYLVTDPHSPPRYRINGIVRNFDEWYRAFDVGPDDALYLPPSERVRIW